MSTLCMIAFAVLAALAIVLLGIGFCWLIVRLVP